MFTFLSNPHNNNDSNDRYIKAYVHYFLSNFNFFPSFPHFPDSKGQTEVE